MSIVNDVNAADKEGPGCVCNYIPVTGTIGKTKCCSLTSGPFLYCTICDNTTPPSNCQPRTEGKDDSDNVFDPNNGGVLSQNDDSSGSKDIHSSKIQQGGSFNQ